MSKLWVDSMFIRNDTLYDVTYGNLLPCLNCNINNSVLFQFDHNSTDIITDRTDILYEDVSAYFIPDNTYKLVHFGKDLPIDIENKVFGTKNPHTLCKYYILYQKDTIDNCPLYFLVVISVPIHNKTISNIISIKNYKSAHFAPFMEVYDYSIETNNIQEWLGLDPDQYILSANIINNSTTIESIEKQITCFQKYKHAFVGIKIKTINDQQESNYIAVVVNYNI